MQIMLHLPYERKDFHLNMSHKQWEIPNQIEISILIIVKDFVLIIITESSQPCLLGSAFVKLIVSYVI